MPQLLRHQLYEAARNVTCVRRDIVLVAAGDFYASVVGDAVAEVVQDQILARNAARKAKDFKEADRIRNELAGMGVQLKDAKDAATGEIVTTWDVT